MRKLLLVFCSILLIVLIGCSSHGDEYTFEQWIEFEDYVGIIKIDKRLSINYTETQMRIKLLDYEYTEINSLKGSDNNKEKLFVVHSSEKEYHGSYCVKENNDNYDDCYNTETEDYIVSNTYFIVIGYFDENRTDALGLRLIEKLFDYDESKPIDEQTELNQDIISKYTSVIDNLESESTESTNTDS